MKLCYFIGTPGPSGSVGNYFTGLGRELANRDCVVKVISSSASDDLPGKDKGENPAFLAWPSPRPTHISDALFLAKLIRRHRPDCLIANFAAVNWMCFVGWLCRVPNRIAFYHTLSSQIDRDDEATNLRTRKAAQVRKTVVYRMATRIAAISQAALSDAQKIFGVPVDKCRLWRYSMEDPARQISLRSPVDRDDLIVCAGRLCPSKGQDVLVAALDQVLTANCSTKVEFLGAGPMLEPLRRVVRQKRYASRCAFAGEVPYPEVVERMSRARLTVVPSRDEAFGLVNIESMSVATPVIASRVGGIPEIIRDGVDGCLVPPDDSAALASALGRLIQDGRLRERMAASARQRFLTEYENGAIVAREADWLGELVSGPKENEANGK